MTHPYPPHWPAFNYVGRHSYSLMFATDLRRPVFADEEVVNLVLAQILRAASEKHFALTAYCFMPDHVHLVVKGEKDDSDCKTFIRAAKQYSGYYYSQSYRRRLWQRYGHDRAIRDDRELALTLRYVVANPVRAGLVRHPREYPFLGSQRYTVDELLEWCEYEMMGDLPAKAGSHGNPGGSVRELPAKAGSHESAVGSVGDLPAKAGSHESAVRSVGDLPPEGGSHEGAVTVASGFSRKI